MKFLVAFCFMLTLSCSTQNEDCLSKIFEQSGLSDKDEPLEFVLFYSEYSCEKCSAATWSKMHESRNKNYRLLIEPRGKSTKRKIVPGFLHDELDKVSLVVDGGVFKCLSSLGIENEAVVMFYDLSGKPVAKIIE